MSIHAHVHPFGIRHKSLKRSARFSVTTEMAQHIGHIGIATTDVMRQIGREGAA